MSIFNGKRLTNSTFKLDIDRMRQGWYSDKYFVNIAQTLQALAEIDYRYTGRSPILGQLGIDPASLATGDIEVEMQVFTRRQPRALIAGVDKALSMLRHCTGHYSDNGQFVETWAQLRVEAVQDGRMTYYHGDPRRVQPVIRIRAVTGILPLLETTHPGGAGPGSRIATNVYNTLEAARGKPVLFFPARFDVHEVQAADGYAYDIAVHRFNQDYKQQVASYVSTDAQGDWWGGLGGGTVAHAAIACFLGDTVEAMLAFAAVRPPELPRIALVDFNNDSVGTSLAVLKAMFDRYQAAIDTGDEATAHKYQLFGVRLDTASNMRDVSIPPLGDKKLDNGVNPRLCWSVRQALDSAWESWNLAPAWQERAKTFCRSVQIAVSGGFRPEKIKWFEELGVPVDIYGVGSSLMSNDEALGTNTDFTADVVRVKLNGAWADMAKVGRTATENPDLALVDLREL
ncbi:MAG: nicotinate phosphoribosyltransferase [Anaerolineales bacterium]|nr:nicotinate phosphoribosyltransferase [Anaerolineales bacterium]